MKKTYFILLACLLTLPSLVAQDTEEYRAGDKLISNPVDDNLYLAGASLTINAPVGGDLTAAGQFITVNDTIHDDVILAGADILINGVLGDDVKIAGRNIQILKNVHGDLLLAGAFVQINGDVVIDKDLVIFAGKATIDGTIKGNVKVTGGNITFNGTAQRDLDIKADELILNGSIHGFATLSSDEIKLRENLEFKSDVTYWSGEGELDLKSYTDGMVVFDENLEPDELGFDEELNESFNTFRLLYTLSIILVIVLSAVLFNNPFQKAGTQLIESYLKSFGYGALYFIGLIVVTILGIILVIGIPIGLVTLSILAFSLMFANAVSSLVIANGISTHYDKNWSKWKVILVALLSFLVLKLIVLIPYVGWFVAIIIITMAFGSLVLSYSERKVTASN